MKEMLKSKSILAFVLIVLGFAIISVPTTKLEDTQNLNEEYLSYNLK